MSIETVAGQEIQPVLVQFGQAKCAECKHARVLHVPGHECAGDFYEGGPTCPCSEFVEDDR